MDEGFSHLKAQLGGGSASKLIYVVVGRIQFLDGWTEDFISLWPLVKGSPSSSPHGPLCRAAHDTAAGFLRPSKVRRAGGGGRKLRTRQKSVSFITSSHIRHILFTRRESVGTVLTHTRGGDYTRVWLWGCGIIAGQCRRKLSHHADGFTVMS